MLEFTVPIRLVNGSNAREHWAQRAKRAKLERFLVAQYMHADGVALCGKAPWKVTLTRIGKRLMDDGNLGISFKHVQDSVAACLGRDDGDRKAFPRWHYEQEIGKEYGVRVRIERV